MATATLDEDKLKSVVKAAFVEALREHRDLVQEIVEEAMEDIALAHAIEQGLGGESVTRDEVFAILEGER
ncbi:MAG TPA: hypothetical protein VJ866_20095 [Pyrinomonadaceae bacterium]|nr:hypothetical protein [Pyrinomonadaceae bacterium]